MATYTYPGVYIQEFEPGAPIAGVGTSTAAFIGPAGAGDPNEAVKLTSWDAFKRAYGELPRGSFYFWYAVRGFFENGGTVCYVVRATTGDYDHVTIQDNGAAAPHPQNTPAPPARDTITFRAKQLGDHASQITVTASASAQPLVKNKKPYDPTGPTIQQASGAQVDTNDATKAALFVPGDTINLGGTPYVVARVSGATIFVTEPISGNPTGTIKLADTIIGTTASIRVDEAAGVQLAPGAVIELSQSGPNQPDSHVVVKSVTAQRLSPALTTYRVDLRDAVTQTYDLSKVTLTTVEFKLQIAGPQSYSHTYDNLSMDPVSPRFFADVLASDPDAILTASPSIPPSTSPVPFNQPVTSGATALTGGKDDDPTALGATHYANALAALESVDDVNLLSAPDSQDAGVQLELLAHCQKMMDRFAILDSKVGAEPFGSAGIITQRNGLDSDKGYAALYYPWLFVPPADGTRPLLVPPSGHVAGIYARIDELRGVHKAPAGDEATVNGAIGVERALSDIDQGQLNPIGINVIRVFKPGGRPTVWGARTTASGVDSNWQYVNIRRLFEYLEESIQEGINWAVFEPNNLELWQKLKRTITDFLTRAWHDGALFGDVAEHAFYVRIDEALNPFSEQQLGRLHIEIGVRPSYPAEFIVVRIGIWDGGGEITES